MAEAGKLPVYDVRIAPKGPRFFRGEDGGVLFEIQLDRRSKIGPRPMVDADRQQYPKAWEAFTEGEQATAEPLIHQDKRKRKVDARPEGGL